MGADGGKPNSFLPVLLRYGFETLEKLPVRRVFGEKKRRLKDFLQTGLVNVQRTPYNAPPLTRNNGLQAAGSAGFSDERRQRKAKLNA
jgi:hypothetical protein